MHTEITDNNADPAGWVFYDGECRICRRWVARVHGMLDRRHFRLLPLQSPEAARRLNLASPALLNEMQLLLGAMPFLRAAYRLLAANRHCANGVCLITHHAKSLDWLPFLVLPAAAMAARPVLPNWVFMWVLALAIFFGCKWLTLRRACAGSPSPHRLTALAYLFLWPGMDADAFLTRRANSPALHNWAGAITKTLAGAGLLWLATAQVLPIEPLLTGWLGMIGVVLLLHFGLFHLLALSWQAAGRDVKPLMHAPLLATSLADFWGNRWNTAFNTLAHDLAFRPLVRRVGVAWTTLAVFLISGVIHDLVISLPARGGYGLPTAYFCVQGLAILFERSRAGRALRLGRGSRGRLFVLIATAAPAYWLFHPTFINNVILPMLKAIGATWYTP